VDLLIDRRELLETARERGLTLAMVEKDYVLGWLLLGLSGIRDLVFKGGTALSKIYFPRLWRLSEDLDFVFLGDFRAVADSLEGSFAKAQEASGIVFSLRNSFSNPDYLQLKISYDAILARNWIKMDVTREAPIDRVAARPLERAFTDYPPFKVRVESLEEIGAEKMRALVERKKSRDFYDVWHLLQLEVNQETLRRLFLKKCAYKGIEFHGLDQILTPDVESLLQGYWERELGRLVRPVPRLDIVLGELTKSLAFLESAPTP
jgi:predicted nucleotidyltransferase component of viral defense system